MAMKNNAEIRLLARRQLKGKWLPAIGTSLVYTALLYGLGFFLGGISTFGHSGYYLKRARGKDANFVDLFDGFRLGSVPCSLASRQIWQVVFTMFLLLIIEGLFIALWTCLFIIPGIIKYLSYSMSYYILRDNPDIGVLEAITKSRKMMMGHKGQLFGLYLSFFGWGLLCVITLGIGVLWLVPYISLSLANFYETLKENQQGE
ncbi:MAG: DUF975 family protein [Spirochaetaceae bacterium]|jgi:uncharacterized membrane protein|nr:DUF975 family protein [Spirochaetaceae bacterium]